MSNDNDELPYLSTDGDMRELVSSFLHPAPEFRRLIKVLKSNPELAGILNGSPPTDQTVEREPRNPMRPAKKDGAPNKDSKLTAAPMTVDTQAVLPVVTDYANGMTQAEIARKHNLHIQTVRKRLHLAGVRTRDRHSALTEEDIRETRSLLETGLSVREIATRLGVAHTTLLRALKRPDTEFKPADPDNLTQQASELRSSETKQIDSPSADQPDSTAVEEPVPIPEIVRLRYPQKRLVRSEIDRLVIDYQAGMPVSQLAAKYGIHRATVTAHLHRRKIPERQPGLNPKQQNEVVRLYRQGHSLREISRRTDLGRKPIRAALIKAGIEIRTQRR